MEEVRSESPRSLDPSLDTRIGQSSGGANTESGGEIPPAEQQRGDQQRKRDCDPHLSREHVVLPECDRNRGSFDVPDDELEADGEYRPELR